MYITEIEDVLKKYKVQEDKVEDLLKKKKISNSEQFPANLCGNNLTIPKLSFEEARKRNHQLLKVLELEFVKGNLRSKAIFSPTELQWEKLCEKYQNNPSLPVQTWHCHLPIFV